MWIPAAGQYPVNPAMIELPDMDAPEPTPKALAPPPVKAQPVLRTPRKVAEMAQEEASSAKLDPADLALRSAICYKIYLEATKLVHITLYEHGLPPALRPLRRLVDQVRDLEGLPVTKLEKQ